MSRHSNGTLNKESKVDKNTIFAAKDASPSYGVMLQ